MLFSLPLRKRSRTERLIHTDASRILAAKLSASLGDGGNIRQGVAFGHNTVIGGKLGSDEGDGGIKVWVDGSVLIGNASGLSKERAVTVTRVGIYGSEAPLEQLTETIVLHERVNFDKKPFDLFEQNDAAENLIDSWQYAVIKHGM